AATDVSGQIVEADDTKRLVTVEQDDRFARGGPFVGDVTPGHDQATVLVQRDTADPPPMLDDGRDATGSFEKVDTALQNVTEDEAAGRFPARAFDQAVPACEQFHCGSAYTGVSSLLTSHFRGKASRTEDTTPARTRPPSRRDPSCPPRTVP